MDETTVTSTTDQAADHVVDSDEFVEDELLVEEISIDGMCGVY
ncbi:mycofactocin precursor MftA [Ilumatobacter sp.]